MRKNFLGVFLTFVIAAIAIKVSELPFAPFTINNAHPISSEIIAIIIGIFLSNTIHLQAKFFPGIDFTVKDLLATAIILLGAKLDFTYVAKSSSSVLLVDVFSVAINLAIGFFVCRMMKLEKELSILLVTGSAICGSSAIIAIAPLIRAHQNHISLALLISSLLGLIAIFICPLIGHAFNMGSEIFGIWVGASVQSVPQVVATGFSFDDKAGEISVIVKLIKVLLLAPTIAMILFLQKNENTSQNSEQKIPEKKFTRFVPPFIFGFIAMVILNSFGVFNVEIFDKKLGAYFSPFSNLLITMVMVGIGLKTNIKACLHLAAKPLVSNFIFYFITSSLTFIFINLIF
jgi:uncharacterized integral membrane protein (TIGR00698 family)